MTQSTLHLFIPGLLHRVPEWLASYGEVGRYPALEWLLSRGALTPSRGWPSETTLCRLFGITEGTPAGALTRMASHPDDPLTGHWLCADPVHLEAGIDDLVLTDASRLSLSVDEAQALVGQVNEHFTHRPWTLEASTADHWHMHLSEATDPGLQTTPLSAAVGQRISQLLPRKSPRADVWLQDLNELQMLLFPASVNQEREGRGLKPVNSLWIWGEAPLPTAPAQPPLAAAFGQGPLLEGLCRWARVPCQALPENAQVLLDTREDVRSGGDALVVLDDVWAQAAYDDLPAWQTGVEALERRWFEPLLKAMQRGRVRRLHLHAGDGQVAILGPGGRWRFWRGSRSLGDLLGGEAP
ncbi:hypothetical protein [Ectothiorhodospira marina]|uniref:Regulatory protein, RpfE type n=1 Tax=Ectothiorhodospira marina TaxID=1396821 RepID=A0A1H7PIZ9_9GAMM|nr:hypothetical protein [Ectothiorhodospira marina]SEL35265.1 hypothetical protein SAMN05444515_11430 [Ectothiorhodospira marina]